MNLLKRWKFTILLVSLLLLMVVHPCLEGSPAVLAALYYLFLAVVFFGAVFVLFQRRRSRFAALALGIPALAGLVTGYLVPGIPATSAALLFHLLPVFFLAYTIATALGTVLVDAEVSADSINGALCGYLLLALAFGHLYCLAEAFRPGSFLLHEQIGPLPTDPGQRHSLLTYFSLVTLTTLGYGDIVPKSPLARSLAWAEAVIGQFYVAVVIAELIGLKVAAAIKGESQAASRQGNEDSP